MDEVLELFTDYIDEEGFVLRFDYEKHQYYNTGINLRGKQGNPGRPGRDGITPHIDRESGHWFIGSVDTGVSAVGSGGSGSSQGGTMGPLKTINGLSIVGEGNISISNGTNGKSAYEIAQDNGYEGSEQQWLVSLQGSDGSDGADGQDGITPHIDPTTRHWMIGEVDTNIIAEGINGLDGTNGQDGTNGVTPHIDPTSKHWIIGNTDTGVVAEGQNGTNGTNGTNGVTPHIDSTTKHWMIGSTDTGIVAEGQNGSNGTNGTNGTNGSDGITPTVNVTAVTGGHNVAFSYGSGDPRNTNFNILDGTTPTGCITSSTTGLKLEVVAALPANPDANTVYIVQ